MNAGLPLVLDPAHEQENDDDQNDQAQTTGWSVSPAPAVTPIRQSADQEQDKNDEQYGSEHGISPSTA